MNDTRSLVAAVLRIIVVLFLFQLPTIKPFFRFDRAAAHLVAKGVPLPKVILVLGVATIIAGSTSLIFERKLRLGAGGLTIVLVAGTFFFYDFRKTNDPHENFMELMNIMFGLAMAGWMAYVVAKGSDALRPRFLANKSNPSSNGNS